VAKFFVCELFKNMLVIRQAQIDALTMGSDEEFVEFLVNHVKEEDPELENEYDDETLREMVRGGIKRAKSHDFSTAEDLTVFVSLMFEIAPNFDEQPEIKAVLDNDKIQPEDRLEALWTEVVPEEAWEKAEENYDEEKWIRIKKAPDKTE
jgi:hypothetical protein